MEEDTNKDLKPYGSGEDAEQVHDGESAELQGVACEGADEPPPLEGSASEVPDSEDFTPQTEHAATSQVTEPAEGGASDTYGGPMLPPDDADWSGPAEGGASDTDDTPVPTLPDNTGDGESAEGGASDTDGDPMLPPDEADWSEPAEGGAFEADDVPVLPPSDNTDDGEAGDGASDANDATMVSPEIGNEGEPVQGPQDLKDMLREEMLAAEACERMMVAGAIEQNGPAHQELPVDDNKASQEQGPPSRRRRGKDLPIVSAELPLREQAHEVLEIIAALPPEALVLYNNRLSRIRRTHKDGVRIESHTKPSLRGVVARSVRIIATKGDDVREVTPSDFLIEDLMSLAEYPETINRVSSVAEMPVFTPEGRLLLNPGLDAASGIYLWPDKSLRNLAIKESPSEQDVQEAFGVIDDAIVDFPFVDKASKANYVAFLLTNAVRPVVGGCVPALVLDAPQQGSGKGLLAAILSIICTGREPGMQPFNGNDEEARKIITAALRRNQPVLVFDNLTHIVNQPSLASFLTSTIWQDRILGHSRIEEFTNSTIMILNGNNIHVGGDLSRRVVWSRLDPSCSRPWERRGFRHHPLLPYVKRQRPDLVRAILTIARHGLSAETMPDAPTLGSFESWSQVTATILSRAGIDGFLENRLAVYERADEEASELEAFLRKWLAVIGSEPVPAKEVVATLEPDDLPSVVMAGHQVGSVVKRLSKTLSRYENRRFGADNIHVVSLRGSGNTLRWQVRTDNSNA